MANPAFLVLADGSVFHGTAIGANGFAVGEVVFNTSMTGYQEILSDPSYCEQIVTLTYPHIGNTGTNSEDNEAEQVWAKGLVIRDYPLLASNFRSEQSLSEYLTDQGVVGIADIDTRRLTRILRDKGAQNGCIVTGDALTEAQALAAANDFAGLKGLDLAQVVTRSEPCVWDSNVWRLGSGHLPAPEAQPFHVVAYDFGAKNNILRMLVERGIKVTVIPAKTSAEEALALNPDGIFLSNGPGDPAPCTYAIEATKVFLEKKLPIFGICLGHQILALAGGAQTLKMKFGHHGANHPVQDIAAQRVMITSQNHGFAVDGESLPSNIKVTHVSLFDQSLQGIEFTDRPALSFQGHPEASPGPHDAAGLFDHFVELLMAAKA